ncbi:MAG: hypothetical protein ACUVUE_05650 [Candidatus Bathycorpusculaceae bacterium]
MEVTWIEWGILAGAVSALAVELGYKVERVGRSIVFTRRREDSTGAGEAQFFGVYRV